MFGNRTHVPRIPELLDNLKAEFESLAHDVTVYKLQRDDYERVLQQQIGEIANIQNTLYELERRHNSLQQLYEEELHRYHVKDPHQNQNNTDSTFRSLQSVISKEISRQNTNATNIQNEPEKTLPSIMANNRGTFQPAETLSAFKGNLLPPTSYHSPHPIPIESNKTPTLNSPTSLSGNKRRLDSPPEKNLFSNGNSFDSQLLKIPKKENNEEISRGLEIDKNSNFQLDHYSKPFHNSFPNGNNHVVNNNNSQERHEIEEKDFKIRYSNPQQTIDIELNSEMQHKSVVCCVKFSKDGKYLATGSNKKARIFSAVDGSKVKTFKDANAKDGDLYFRSVCFSPDGKFLACGAEDKTIKLWDIEQEKISHTFVSHTMDIYSLDYSNDGTMIVSGSGDKKVKLWDVTKGKCLYTLGNEEVGPKDGVTSVVMSPDRRTIAAGSLDRVVRLWDVETGNLLERFEGHLDSVYSVSFSMDGRTLASGSLDRTLKLWDVVEPRSRGKARSTFLGHSDFVLSVVFSPDDNWLISGSKDRTVQFWDPRTNTSHCKLEGHTNSVISVDINPVTTKFATGSGDSKAKLWNYKINGQR